MLDIRIPISILFLLVGALLALYGAVFHPSTPATANLNLDLDWGLVMGLFGIAMGAWIRLSRSRTGEMEGRVPAAGEAAPSARER